MFARSVRTPTPFWLILFLFLCLPFSGGAIVKYDEGAMTVNGIQLLQDRENPNAYYYIPPYPRLSVLGDGQFEFLCIKYVGLGGRETSGGLFHALVQFTLPPEELRELEARLKEKAPRAKLMGAVPMMDAIKDGEPGMASFRLVSSVLNNTGGANPFTINVITSGKAPFLPGSKAAVAARLSPEGASLLWETFRAGTSDVSVVVDGYFEAAVKAYNATVQADLEVAYEHFSSFRNKQQGFSRRQARQAVDSLVQSGAIKVDVFDRTASLGLKAGEMQAIVDLVTQKVLDLMFDTKTGWARLPDRTAAAEPAEIKERYKRGDFVAFFAGDGDQEYIPDDQYLLKDKKEIRNFHFFLNLSQSTTIKVPVHSAGNIRGFYDLFKDDGRYFRVVNLDDPVFQKREVHFQIDGGFLDSYADLINFATVSVRKAYSDQNAPFTTDLVFQKKDIEAGQFIKSIVYPRLGQSGADWVNYEYKVAWSIRGCDSALYVPTGADTWAKTDLPAISLAPPLDRRVVEIDADRSLFREAGIRSASIRFASVLCGKPQRQKMVILRDDDNSQTLRTALYCDPRQPVAYQTTWYSNAGEHRDELRLLDGDYLFLVPPPREVFSKN